MARLNWSQNLPPSCVTKTVIHVAAEQPRAESRVLEYPLPEPLTAQQPSPNPLAPEQLGGIGDHLIPVGAP